MLERLLHCSFWIKWRLPESLNGRPLVLGHGWAFSLPMVSRLRPFYSFHHQTSHLGQAPKPSSASMAYLCFLSHWRHLRTLSRYRYLKKGERTLHLRQIMRGNRYQQRVSVSDQPQDWGFPLDSNFGLRKYSLPLLPLSSNGAPPKCMYPVPR